MEYALQNWQEKQNKQLRIPGIWLVKVAIQGRNPTADRKNYDAGTGRGTSKGCLGKHMH